jgi:hypothetical protein
MNTRGSPRRPRTHNALTAAGLGLLAAVVLGQAAEGPAGKEPAKRRTTAKQAAHLVEAIANRNKGPKTISRHQLFPRKFPLYPKDYDWKEEERVRKALEELGRDTSIEVWEAEVRKADDRRYSIASYSGNSSDVEMWDVGQICYGQAYSRLCDVFMKHLPSLPPHGSPIQMWDVIKDFPTWRKARKDKALYQLQIEICEIALREVPKLRADELSDKEKAEARKGIQAEIDALRESKKPILEPLGTQIPYPREEAERVREAYEKGTLEQFGSRLNW